MAIQTIGLGTVADDGTGDTLRVAGDKINDNFNDVYTTLGDGTTLTAPAPTANPTFTGVITGVTADLSGDVAIGGDLSLDHDGAVLNFGADSEINFTHVHDIVEGLVKNDISQYHDNKFALQTPMSPHAAAQIDNVVIKVNDIKRPKTKNKLVVEGAGGLLVPLNDTETIIDLIQPKDKVIVVSRHYLGSINHTLMTIETIKNRGLIPAGIIFSGDEHPTTEAIITTMSQVPIIGRIDEEPYFDTNVVCEYADRFRESLQKL